MTAIGINKVSELLKYLDRQTNPEFEKQIGELRNKAAEIITDGYMKFLDDTETDFSRKPMCFRRIVFETVQENFELLKENILTNGLSKSFWRNLDPKITENLRNWEIKIQLENEKKNEKEETKENQEGKNTRKTKSKVKIEEEKDVRNLKDEKPEVKETRGRKRQEPVETEETNPELKKTKKAAAPKNKKR